MTNYQLTMLLYELEDHPRPASPVPSEGDTVSINAEDVLQLHTILEELLAEDVDAEQPPRQRRRLDASVDVHAFFPVS